MIALLCRKWIYREDAEPTAGKKVPGAGATPRAWNRG